MTQHTMHPRSLSVLSIAGSDSGGGAGIQADLKTFAAHGLHGLSALAALTAQNTRTVTRIHIPPEAFLATQIDTLFADFHIAATKIGMLATQTAIETVTQALQQYAAIHVVLDPVMIASSGAALLEADAIAALREQLLPRADIITPNLPEAESLTGLSIPNRNAMRAAAKSLRALGARAVLLKGGHLKGPEVIDLYCDSEVELEIVHPRLAIDCHGTGCTLSAAIAANLALGLPMPRACQQACSYLHGALRNACQPGSGMTVVLAHFWQWRQGERDFSQCGPN